MPKTLVAALLLLPLAAVGRLHPAPPARLILHDCQLPDLSEKARCGTLQVFENRQTRTGRKISLRVVVLPAKGTPRAPDPLFYIAGGPGGSVVAGASYLARDSIRLRAHRDIVLVDQRGAAGQSHPLDCDFYAPADSLQPFLGDFLPQDAVRRCRDRYAPNTDLTQYTTSNAVDDFDEVRQALGYARLNVIGGSYGTRAALELARRHPTSVRTMLLEGVVPPGTYMPLHFARDAQRSLDALLDECAADQRCHDAFPELRSDVAHVLDTLSRGPVVVQVTDPRNSRTASVRLPYDMVTETLRYMLYVSEAASLIPVAFHRAAGGDFTWLAQTSLDARGAFSGKIGQFDGLYIAATCAEDLAFIKPGEGVDEAKGTFLRDYRLRQQQDACAIWPHGRISANFHTPVTSAIPALLLSGALDPVTPPEQGAEAARHLTNSLHVIVPHGGHDPYGLNGLDCIDRLEHDFIERGSVAGLDTSCVSRITRPPFPTTLPSSPAP